MPCNLGATGGGYGAAEMEGDGKRLACDCGVVIEAPSEDELVAGAQAHALDAHAIRFSAEQIIALAAAGSRGRTHDES